MKRDEKKKVIKDHGKHGDDTGSSQVQVAILTHRINSLSEHLKDHPNDKHSRRGLIGLVGKRRKHLMYLKMNEPEVYTEVLQSLQLRK
jgi:small subunit ribosomal protein S15